MQYGDFHLGLATGKEKHESIFAAAAEYAGFIQLPLNSFGKFCPPSL